MTLVYKDIEIGDICIVGDGAHASIKRKETGVLYLSSRNFKDGRLDLSKVYYISEEDFAKHFKEGGKAMTKPQSGDVALSIIGTIGEPYVVKPNDRFGISSAVAFMRPDYKKVDSNYLYYWLKGPEFQQAVYSVKGGVAQGYVSLEMIKRLPFRIFSLDIQRKIALILSNYDNLIENNNRRIAILEDMAQSLYREWFVHFRFPGHETCQFKHSELGRIPEGWEVKPIAEEIEILGGGTPKKSESQYWDEEVANINWYTPSNLTKHSSMFIQESDLKITDLGLKKSSAKLFPAYSVMMTSRATIGVISINTTPACTNQGFIVCVPNERVSTEYIHYWLIANMQSINNLASGATFKEVRRTLFKELPFLIPNKDLMNKFNESMKPLTRNIEVLISKNKNLKTQRDMLLPKLINGNVLI